jgi:hypothetical protein
MVRGLCQATKELLMYVVNVRRKAMRRYTPLWDSRLGVELPEPMPIDEPRPSGRGDGNAQEASGPREFFGIDEPSERDINIPYNISYSGPPFRSGRAQISVLRRDKKATVRKHHDELIGL